MRSPRVTGRYRDDYDGRMIDECGTMLLTYRKSMEEHPELDYRRWSYDEERTKLVSVIPAHFRSATCERVLGDVGLYLHGAVGVGKTHTAAALAIQGIDAGLSVQWLSGAAWLAAWRASFSGAEPPPDALEYVKCDLIVLDDLGAEKPSDWACEQLYTLVNALYEVDVQVIVTSNMKISALSRHLGDRIASRIVELCDPVEIVGNDRRLVAAKNRREK